MPQGNLVEVLGREVRQGSPGELMVESLPSRQRRPACKTNKEMSHEAADAAALTYLLTYSFIHLSFETRVLVLLGMEWTSESTNTEHLVRRIACCRMEFIFQERPLDLKAPWVRLWLRC